MNFFKYPVLYLVILIVLGSCNPKEKNNDVIRAIPTDNVNRTGAKLESLKSIMESNSDNAETYYKRAELYLEDKRGPEALADAKKAVRLDSFNGKHYLSLAKAYKITGDINAGVNAANKAKNLELNTPELYITLAELYLSKERHDTASMYLDKALEIAPFEEKAFYLKGLLFSQKGDTINAVSNLKVALKQNSELPEVYNELAKVYLQRKETDVAFAFLDKGLRINPEDGALNYHKGVAYLQKDNSDSARIYFRKAMFYEGEIYNATFQMGLLSYKAGLYSESLAHFEKAVDMKPESSDANFWLAQVNSMSGRKERAISYYQKVVALGKTYVKESNLAINKLTYVAPRPQERPQVKLDIPQIAPRPLSAEPENGN